MKNFFRKLKDKFTNKVVETAVKLNNDERGIDVVVMVVVLVILIGVAVIFRTQITQFVNNLFQDVLAFK